MAEFSGLEKIEIGLTVPEAVEAIPLPDAAVCLYRVAQESLRNIVKHSGVDYAEVKLSVDDQEVRLQVADPHWGFDPISARNSGGLGSCKHGRTRPADARQLRKHFHTAWWGIEGAGNDLPSKVMP